MLAKRIFRIQYVSDLHIECYKKAVFPLLVKPAARYLALAGDIGQPGHRVFESFLNYASSHWDHVFYIPGTKEFSTRRTVRETHAYLADMIDTYPNIHYFHYNNPSFTTKENVTILGATMWPRNVVYPNITATRAGSNERFILGPFITHPFQKEMNTMLEAQINYNAAMKLPICMLTHHMPSVQLLSPRFPNHLENNRFVSEAEGLMIPPVKAWIYGKTHNVCTGMLNDVFTAVNARGYPNEYVPGFSSTAFLEFPVFETDSDIDPELAKSAYL